MPGSDRVNPASPGVKLTYDDYLLFPEDGNRHELIDGEERWGVSEYWVVDPDTEVVRVYRRGAEGFERVTELSGESGDVLTTPLLSGLELPLARIFRE